MRYCHFGVATVNYSDSDLSDSDRHEDPTISLFVAHPPLPSPTHTSLREPRYEKTPIYLHIEWNNDTDQLHRLISDIVFSA